MAEDTKSGATSERSVVPILILILIQEKMSVQEQTVGHILHTSYVK